MRYITLQAVTDEYDTEPGFAVKGTPRGEEFFADRNGLMIAHDIVEHQNGVGEIGSVWDELEALGGVWHSRGRWGDFENSYHSAESHLASDITRMARDVSYNWFRDYDMMGPVPKNTRPHDHDDAFLAAIDIARKDIPRELDSEDKESFDIEAYLAEALHRLRTGFRKAEKRWAHLGHFGSNNQFNAIRNAVKHAHSWIDCAGQEFRLAYGAGRADIQPITEDFDY